MPLDPISALLLSIIIIFGIMSVPFVLVILLDVGSRLHDFYRKGDD